uniref:Leucine-rich repeat and coiled-coil domain-containing protein 1 n=1 Tax=Physcomitrium patens TaxID=3218 RepID=A0A7I4E439_PHYPA
MSDEHRVGSNGASGPLLDVRDHNSRGRSDEEVKDIYVYGAGLHSTNAIIGLSDFTNLQTLSLHGNQIELIQGLEVLHKLISLNLSSNKITLMEGLSQLKSLRVLNLSNNRIKEIKGLKGLVSIRKLILSHNQISLLGGLSSLQGPSYSLQYLDLRDNLVECLSELWMLGGLSHLEELVLQCGGYTNPVCKANEYRLTLFSVAPHIRSLDGSSFLDSSAPLIKLDSVSPLRKIQHLYPCHQNPANPEPKTIRFSLGDRHLSCTLGTKPAPVVQHEHTEFPVRLMFDSSKNDTGTGRSNCCENGCILQNQKPVGCYVLRHKSSQHESDPYQVYYVQKGHDPGGNQMQGSEGSVHTNTQNLTFNADCNASLRKGSREYEVVLKEPGNSVLNFGAQHPEATVPKDEFRNKGVHYNTHPRSIPKSVEDRENSFAGAATRADAGRYVRFVDRSTNSLLEKTTCTMRDLATQTETEIMPALDQVCQTNCLQSKLSKISVGIDGNSSYTEIEKPQYPARLDIYEKDNEILYCIKEKKLLEDEFAAFKLLVDQERNNWQIHDEHKLMAFASLEINLKGCQLELRNVRNTVAQTERRLIAEVKNVESSLVSEETVKFCALNAEIMASKEALNSAMNASQTVGEALTDANHQKERAKRALVSLTAALDEQRSKVKLVTELLDKCTQEERRSRRECSRLKEELNFVCQENKQSGVRDLIQEKARCWEEVEKESQQFADELHHRLVITHTMICLFRQENDKSLSNMRKLRDMMNEKMEELRKGFEAAIEKERGGDDLIAELSYVVSAQKNRLERMQHELACLVANKQAVENLQAEIVQLKQKISASEQRAVEVEALKCELVNATSIAERERRALEEATCARFSSLVKENERLAAKASSLALKFQETQNVIKVKIEVCESQEAMIQQLKTELVEAKNAARISEANIKVIEADLVKRLHDEVEQKCELRTELTSQENTISDMEEELELMKSAKCAAEHACKSLQHRVKDVDLLLRNWKNQRQQLRLQCKHILNQPNLWRRKSTRLRPL